MSMKRLLNSRQPRGAVAGYVAISSIVIFGIAALAIDIGNLYATRAELQRCADASALAGCWELLDDRRIRGGASRDAMFLEARNGAALVAWRNSVLRQHPTI